jgi:hypothetical protein
MHGLQLTNCSDYACRFKQIALAATITIATSITAVELL